MFAISKEENYGDNVGLIQAMIIPLQAELLKRGTRRSRRSTIKSRRTRSVVKGNRGK